jgi:hypothetical protein
VDVESQITAIAKRHIGRCLSQLEEAGTPEVCLAAVKREFWYMSDDIKQVVSKNEEEQDGSEKTKV